MYIRDRGGYKGVPRENKKENATQRKQKEIDNLINKSHYFIGNGSLIKHTNEGGYVQCPRKKKSNGRGGEL